MSSETAFSSGSELLLLLSAGGGVVGASAIYGGGGAEAGMDLYPKFGTDEYDGGSLRPCGNGDGIFDTWQKGQYDAKRGFF